MKKPKHLLTFCMALLLCTATVACQATPSSEATTVTEGKETAPMESKVEILGRDGISLPYYSAILWSFDGQIAADGELMFLSVSEYLPRYADHIPSVELGEAPEIRATARDGVSIEGGETVSIYSEDFALLAEYIPLSELIARGKTEWAGKTVYIYFTVTFRLTGNGKYLPGHSYGYFVKTTFAQ